MFSEDLTRAAVDPAGSFMPLSPEAVEQTAYLRTDFLGGDVEDRCEAADTSPQSCYRPLVTRADTKPGVQFGYEFNGHCTILDCGPIFLAANASLSAVILGAREPLTETPVATYQTRPSPTGSAKEPTTSGTTVVDAREHPARGRAKAAAWSAVAAGQQGTFCLEERSLCARSKAPTPKQAEPAGALYLRDV